MRRGNFGKRFWGAILSACVVGLLSLPAGAQPAIKTTPHEIEDQQEVSTAVADFKQSGFVGVGKHERRLRNVLDHAPANYPLIDQQGDVAVIHASDLSEYILLSAGAEAVAKNEGRKLTRAVMQPNTYPLAATLLGSYYDEMKRPDQALAVLDRGLAMQPHNLPLTIEKGSALMYMHRASDAVALYTAALDSNDMSIIMHRARLLKNKGVALIELGRLDEAEAALNESLKAEPNNASAQHELDYIRQLRAGGPKEQFVLKTPTASPKPAASPSGSQPQP